MYSDLQPIDDFWRGKRCLMTGADGFLAGHISSRLIRSGAMVYGIIRNRRRMISTLDLFNLRSRMTIFRCDVRDYKDLLDIIASEDIDTIFHLAAASTTGAAARSPLAALETNFLGTANVLEACRQSGVRRIMVASSDKAYGDHRDDLPLTEMHSLRGLQVYECSKSCTDLLAQTYYSQFQLPVRITRCCNIYGPGDLNFSRLIPGTIARLMETIPPNIRPGQGEALREYLFVSDAVDAYLAIAKSISQERDGGIPSTGVGGYSHCAYNIGSGTQNVQTTKALMYLLQELMEADITPEEDLPQSATLIESLNHQFLDSQKIESHLGWSARYELKDGLRETVSWYQENRETLKPLYEADIIVHQ